MTVVVHLTEAPHEDLPVLGEHVRLVRHSFAAAIADTGLASVLAAIGDQDPTERLVIVHPDVDQPGIDQSAIDHLSSLMRRSQRRRSMIMVGHGLGPLGADLLVEQLAHLLSDRSVSLDDAAAWCERSEARITDVVWAHRAHPRWAHVNLRDRLRSWLPGRQVRTRLGPQREVCLSTRNGMLTDLPMTGADVTVSGPDTHVVARMVKQLATARASSVRVVESGSGSPVAAEVVISSTTSAR